jgi:hypothetical protein
MSYLNMDNSMLSKAYAEATPYGDISAQQERIKKAMRGGYNTFNQSITGIKTAIELRPALQVKQSTRFMGKGALQGSAMPAKLPALDKEAREKNALDQSMDRSFQVAYEHEPFENTMPATIPTKIFTCPPEWK